MNGNNNITIVGQALTWSTGTFQIQNMASPRLPGGGQTMHLACLKSRYIGPHNSSNFMSRTQLNLVLFLSRDFKQAKCCCYLFLSSRLLVKGLIFIFRSLLL